jgi:hypothetical protein
VSLDGGERIAKQISGQLFGLLLGQAIQFILQIFTTALKTNRNHLQIAGSGMEGHQLTVNRFGGGIDLKIAFRIAYALGEIFMLGIMTHYFFNGVQIFLLQSGFKGQAPFNEISEN